MLSRRHMSVVATSAQHEQTSQHITRKLVETLIERDAITNAWNVLLNATCDVSCTVPLALIVFHCAPDAAATSRVWRLSLTSSAVLRIDTAQPGAACMLLGASEAHCGALRRRLLTRS